jgi:hypothetical protein
MQPERISDESMRTFMHETLMQNPEASQAQVMGRWRVIHGRSSSPDEEAVLSNLYEGEATSARAELAERRAGAGIDAPTTFRVTKQEIFGLVAVLLPFVLAVESSTVFRQGGVVTGGTYFSLGGLIGGLVAIGLAIAIAKAVLRGPGRDGSQIVHGAIAGVILLLGVYHVLHGLGVLHTLGILKFS